MCRVDAGFYSIQGGRGTGTGDGGFCVLPCALQCECTCVRTFFRVCHLLLSMSDPHFCAVFWRGKGERRRERTMEQEQDVLANIQLRTTHKKKKKERRQKSRKSVRHYLSLSSLLRSR